MLLKKAHRNGFRGCIHSTFVRRIQDKLASVQGRPSRTMVLAIELWGGSGLDMSVVRCGV